MTNRLVQEQSIAADLQASQKAIEKLNGYARRIQYLQAKYEKASQLLDLFNEVMVEPYGDLNELYDNEIKDLAGDKVYNAWKLLVQEKANALQDLVRSMSKYGESYSGYAVNRENNNDNFFVS